MNPTETQRTIFIAAVMQKTGQGYDEVVRRYPKIASGAYIGIEEWQWWHDVEGLSKIAHCNGTPANKK